MKSDRNGVDLHRMGSGEELRGVEREGNNNQGGNSNVGGKELSSIKEKSIGHVWW